MSFMLGDVEVNFGDYVEMTVEGVDRRHYAGPIISERRVLEVKGQITEKSSVNSDRDHILVMEYEGNIHSITISNAHVNGLPPDRVTVHKHRTPRPPRKVGWYDVTWDGYTVDARSALYWSGSSWLTSPSSERDLDIYPTSARYIGEADND